MKQTLWMGTFVFAMASCAVGCEKKPLVEVAPVADTLQGVSPLTPKANAKEVRPLEEPVLETATKGRAFRAWQNLARMKCDGAKAGVWTSLQARILREAPRAIANGPIGDTRLRAFYEQDHEGYDGTKEGLLGLERETAICMAKMEGRSILLRETTPWLVNDAVEGRLLMSPNAFELLNQATQGATEYPFGDVRSGVDTNGRLWLQADRKGCEPSQESESACLRLEIECMSLGECSGNVL